MAISQSTRTVLVSIIKMLLKFGIPINTTELFPKIGSTLSNKWCRTLLISLSIILTIGHCPSRNLPSPILSTNKPTMSDLAKLNEDYNSMLIYSIEELFPTILIALKKLEELKKSNKPGLIETLDPQNFRTPIPLNNPPIMKPHLSSITPMSPIGKCIILDLLTKIKTDLLNHKFILVQNLPSKT